MPNYIERAVLLLKSRYFVLSTLDAQGPWTTPLNHVVSFSDEVTLVYYSNPSSRHSLALNNDKNTSGAIYEIDSDGNADGMQFVCTVEPIPVDDLERVHKYYYENNFPNPAEREEWLIPREQFLPDGVHWFYRVRLTRAWLIDVETWDTDRVDRRVEVDLHSVVNGA